jgi:hypothetical protein
MQRLLFFIFSFALLFQSCKKEGETVNIITDKNGSVEIFETTKVIANGTEVVSVSANTARLSGDMSQLKTIKIGDVLVAPATKNAPNGLLARVETVRTENGELVVTTRPAALTDAVKNAKINIKQAIQPNQITDRANGFAYQMNNIVLFDADANSTTTYDQVRVTGNGTFTPDMTMDIDINNGNLSYFNFQTDFQNTLTENFKAGGTLPFNVSRVLYDQELSAITIWVGWFPIVITPSVQVKVGANGQVTAVVEASYTNTATLSAYIRYQNGAWTNGSSRSMTNTFVYNGITANLNATGWVRPSLTCKLYGSDNARASVFAQGNLILAASLSPTRTCSLKGGISAGADARLQILSWTVADVSYPSLLSFQRTLYTCQ